MALGFRKSLFGFNCDDVVDYIEQTHRKFKNKADNLTKTADELANQLALSQQEYKILLEEKQALSEKLDEFTAKAEEIEQLSEKIGKLYLVSQTNAQVIINTAEENSAKAQDEVQKNLSTIDEAHASLNELRQNIIKTSDNFIKEVDCLLSSLDSTREKITENTKKSQEAIENFEAVYSNIVNE